MSALSNLQPPSGLYPLNNHSSTSWKSSVPAVITPVVPVLPPPIVITPTDISSDPQIPTADPLHSLSQLATTSGYVEAPAVAVATKRRGKVPRPITGRGYRDQLQAATFTDVTVRLCVFYLIIKLNKIAF